MLVQLVDDTKGVTLASASTMEKDLRGIKGDKETNMSDAFKQLPMPPAREV